MRQDIKKIISREYQSRRDNNAQKTQDRIDRIYFLYPELREIDRSIMKANADIAIQIIKDGAPRKESPEKSALIRQRNDFMSHNGIPLDFDMPVYNCSTCHDTGILDSSQNKMCRCYHQLLIPLLLKNSNFKNISKYSFSQFDDSLFSDAPDPKRYQSSDSPRKQINGIRNAVKHFLEKFDDESTRNLFFLGNPGTGKTFLSGCIANELLMEGKSVLYLSSPELYENITEFRMLSNSFSPDPERFEQASEMYQSILNCDLFIMDDLGTETIHSNRQPELLNILNHRIDYNKKMLISTNLDAAGLSNLYDERVLSRIYGNFSVLRFFGDDLRHVIKTRN
ncbi:MAG: ATP-binding protein [Saccharofermentanales bacterium]